MAHERACEVAYVHDFVEQALTHKPLEVINKLNEKVKLAYAKMKECEAHRDEAYIKFMQAEIIHYRLPKRVSPLKRRMNEITEQEENCTKLLDLVNRI